MSKRDLVALANFCNDYHSGQNSRGYRLLCVTLRKLERIGISRPIDHDKQARRTSTYKKLEDRYSKKM